MLSNTTSHISQHQTTLQLTIIPLPCQPGNTDLTDPVKVVFSCPSKMRRTVKRNTGETAKLNQPPFRPLICDRFFTGFHGSRNHRKLDMLNVLRHAVIVTALSGTFVSVPLLHAEAPAKQAATEFPQIHEKLKEFVKQNEIAGAVTVVVTPDKVIHLDTLGMANIEKQIPMQPDTMFWVASMTKPFAGLAICKLEEEGKLKLEDTVDKYIPEFKNLKNDKGEPVQITILQLLTHTAGLQEVALKDVIDIPNLAGLIPLYVAKPVQFVPGSQWRYSQSGINTAGRIVEILSGLTFDEYLKKEFFEPIGMTSSAFYLTPEQNDRLATAYNRTPEGKLEANPTNRILLDKKSPTSRDRYPAPNAGLFSTAPDYGKFCQFLLNEGSVNGKQIVKPETIKRFRTIHTTPEHKTGFTPGNGWGVGTCVVREPQGITAKMSPGTFGHGGAYGTQFWIDPERKIGWVLMVQRSNFQNGDASVVREAFQNEILK